MRGTWQVVVVGSGHNGEAGRYGKVVSVQPRDLGGPRTLGTTSRPITGCSALSPLVKVKVRCADVVGGSVLPKYAMLPTEEVGKITDRFDRLIARAPPAPISTEAVVFAPVCYFHFA